MRRFILVLMAIILSGPLAIHAQTMPALEVSGYDLGESTLIDPFLDDLEIPFRLQGVIALPASDQPAPLVIILHGRHAICGFETAAEWPCPEIENRYDQGFTYLAEGLAERGYAAIAMNINAAMTTFFTMGDIDARARQIFDQQMAALMAADGTGSDAFGVNISGRIDFSQMALIGHSSGGGAALALTRAFETPPFALLLVAAAMNRTLPERTYQTPEALFEGYRTPSNVPVAAILPDCDRDQVEFRTQIAYEAARFDPDRSALAATVRLFRADHNQFNTNLMGRGRDGYPPCFSDTGTLLPPEDQQRFLLNYTADFLDLTLGRIAPNAAFDILQAPPTELYGLPVETNLTTPSADRLTLLEARAPFSAEVQVNALNGRIVPNQVGVSFCAPSTVCYGGILAAGRFGHWRLDYQRYGRIRDFQLEIPESRSDFSTYDVLHIRAVPDYLSRHNSPDIPQAFGISLIDRSGVAARLDLTDLPNMQIPPPVEFYDYSPFVLYPASIRIPLEAFEGVDLSALAEVVLHFTLVDSGTLLIADIEFLRAE